MANGRSRKPKKAQAVFEDIAVVTWQPVNEKTSVVLYASLKSIWKGNTGLSDEHIAAQAACIKQLISLEVEKALTDVQRRWFHRLESCK
jgi:hypothetical protein